MWYYSIYFPSFSFELGNVIGGGTGCGGGTGRGGDSNDGNLVGKSKIQRIVEIWRNPKYNNLKSKRKRKRGQKENELWKEDARKTVRKLVCFVVISSAFFNIAIGIAAYMWIYGLFPTSYEAMGN